MSREIRVSLQGVVSEKNAGKNAENPEKTRTKMQKIRKNAENPPKSRKKLLFFGGDFLLEFKGNYVT